MYASLSWIAALLGQTLDPQEAARRLTLAGATVDAVEPIHQQLGDVVVGVVERVEQHPDADRLSLCRVVAGGEPVEVVCGAPNVRPGATYPYAAPGATLPGGLTLERRKIRGVVSNGMLCSAKELGLGTDQAGLMEVFTDAAPGTPFLQVMPVADTRLLVDVTPNRPDLLSQRGIARELAAAYGLTLRLPEFPGAAARAPRRAGAEGTVAGVDVRIEDPAGCPRYIAAVIRGVKVGPSPAWLEARLRTVGARPINNVVDATNYVLHEINQPMHAFDLATLRSGALVIRRARAGERLVTLDGEERALTTEMTMICDGEGPIAVAGVMGGANSEVSERTTDVLLECAYFDPARVRVARTTLKMSTDASYRFERGTDQLALAQSVRRAVELILAVAGGQEPEAALDLWPTPQAPRTVFLRPSRVGHLLGIDVPRAEIEQLLAAVGFTAAPKDERLAVQVPGWRPDVTREVDLIEEVARLRGYEHFPTERRPFRPTAVPSAPSEATAAQARRLLTGRGLHEARTLPLGAPGGPEAPAVLNPLSSEEGHLRTGLIPGLVRSVEYNWSLRQRDVRLFEIGRVFRACGTDRAPEETIRVAAVLTGARTPPHWSDAGRAPDLDLWDAKAMFEEAARAVGPVGAHLESVKGGWVLRDAAGAVRGRAGPLEADCPPWAAGIVGFEFDLDDAPRAAVRHRGQPATPTAERDVALVLPVEVRAADVERVMRAAGGARLESLQVFDEYRGEGLAGRSVAWRLVFRDPERTLRDADVDHAVETILVALRSELGVERRET
ncbi:MAG: phenylalanine--tRNA ligase subunit beta [Gemmatimonadota bacterium]|nr:phenylalanine--tRNA ligase subunit beta [Gemmatimonadota bacterium]